MHDELIKKKVPALPFVISVSDIQGYLIRDFRCPSLSSAGHRHLVVAKMLFIADRERFIRITV